MKHLKDSFGNDETAEMNERAFGSRVRRFCAILAILCIPYQDIRRFQSFSCPSSRTRLTTYGALASRSIESLSTSQKRYSENECMNSLSLIDTKIVTFSDTRLKLVFEIDNSILVEFSHNSLPVSLAIFWENSKNAMPKLLFGCI